MKISETRRAAKRQPTVLTYRFTRRASQQKGGATGGTADSGGGSGGVADDIAALVASMGEAVGAGALLNSESTSSSSSSSFSSSESDSDSGDVKAGGGVASKAGGGDELKGRTMPPKPRRRARHRQRVTKETALRKNRSLETRTRALVGELQSAYFLHLGRADRVKFEH